MKSGVHIQNLISSLGTIPRSKKSHLQFCKRYLEVSNKASNVACRAELGRFPLIIAINQKIMNYSSYLLSKDNCSIVKQIFLMSQDLHHADEKSYYSNIISLSKYYDFPCFDITYLTDAKIKHCVSLMQQKYILHWQHTMQNSTKLEFFNTFKNDYAPSSYLGLTNKLSERKELVKLRIGNHKLRIETGRYDQIPRVNRLCPICASNQIEDESHFLIYYNKYSILRNKFYRKIEHIIPNFKQLPLLQAISDLMTSSDHYINIQLTKYISSCFDLRNILLFNQTNVT